MLNYHIEGHGPPLLLVHGFGISFNIWNGLRPLLRGHFTLVEVELPGIGFSPLPPPTRPYLAAAVDALDITRAALGFDRWRMVGYSTGSRIAEAYAQTQADRVERVAFLNPIRTDPFRALGLRVGVQIDARFPQFGDWVLSYPRFKILVDQLAFNGKPCDLARAWAKEITSQPMKTRKATLRSLPDGGGLPFQIPDGVPAIFIWGREDRLVPCPRRSSDRDRILQADHSMPQTRACEVAEILLEFFK